MGPPSSCRHSIVGWGSPVARHLRVRLIYSCITISWLLGKEFSSNFGGTREWENNLIDFSWDILHAVCTAISQVLRNSRFLSKFRSFRATLASDSSMPQAYSLHQYHLKYSTEIATYQQLLGRPIVSLAANLFGKHRNLYPPKIHYWLSTANCLVLA